VEHINEDMYVCDVTLHVDNISDGGDVVMLLCKDGRLVELNKVDDYSFIAILK
jgi:hypothetical protein